MLIGLLFSKLLISSSFAASNSTRSSGVSCQVSQVVVDVALVVDDVGGS